MPGKIRTELSAYARQEMPTKKLHHARRSVLRAGGVEKLRKLSPEVRRILLGLK